jgi:coenzyme F420-reducing hydrogenase beta subunit
MQEDHEGFYQPVIETKSCNDCGLCRKICPVNSEQEKAAPTIANQDEGQYPTAWAAWNLDETVRFASSSGGVFSALSEDILNKGGVVVGAAFDEQFVLRHVLIEKSSELHRLRGSKYVQSQIAPTLYKEIKDLLRTGRSVLFSGTPCQVAGLRSMLRRQYSNLFCCDILCHGVPSPKLLRRYLDDCASHHGQLRKISFRDKITGWKHYSINLLYANGQNMSELFFHNSYMKAFLQDMALRHSCYHCPFTRLHRQGDLTLADFWGVAQKYPDYDAEDKGTSLVLVNNKHGQDWLNGCRGNLFLGAADLDSAVSGNPVLVRPSSYPQERDTFFRDLGQLSFKSLVKRYRLGNPSFARRVVKGLRRRVGLFLKKCRGYGAK